MAVISHPTWQTDFGGDPGIVGRVVRLNGTNRTIIGVMKPGLKYPYRADFWVPMTTTDDREGTWGRVLGLLEQKGRWVGLRSPLLRQWASWSRAWSLRGKPQLLAFLRRHLSPRKIAT